MHFLAVRTGVLIAVSEGQATGCPAGSQVPFFGAYCGSGVSLILLAINALASAEPTVVVLPSRLAEA
jgi:hypothetical protein